jgi:hypothetical protein
MLLSPLSSIKGVLLSSAETIWGGEGSQGNSSGMLIRNLKVLKMSEKISL